MRDGYLVDTSVWIDYFRDRNKILNDFIDRLIDENKVYICGIVKAEILIGTRTQKEYDLMKNSLASISSIPTDDQIFDLTSNTGFKLRRKGITVPMSDLVIAVQCYYNNLILIENDKHFDKIKECLNINLYE